MSKLQQLEAERAALAPQEHAAWELMKSEERRLTAIWGGLNLRLQAINKEIEQEQMREQARADVLAEIQAQQATIVPVSTEVAV